MELASRYWSSFAILVGVCVVLFFMAGKDKSSADEKADLTRFNAFQKNYLLVFLLAMFSDWLQGPYVYELYVSYGYDQQAIAELFVCGFGSSMIVGTFVGGLADKYGRKVMCILYAVTYIAACMTKLFNHYWILMIGRFLSGIATSLLFSAFETWMVCEHSKNGFDSSLIGNTFSLATFGNGLIAVIAGIVAKTAAESFGFVGPFMVAILPLTAVAGIVATTWNENYGDQRQDMLSSLSKGFQLIRNDSSICALGIAQSCFEGAMYIFVFMWTPAIKTDAENRGEESEDGESTSQYLGLIFSCFMVSVMVGSSIFKLVNKDQATLYKIPLFVHGGATLAMILITIMLDVKPIVYWMFLIFELTVGLFYPAYGCIKSEKIPEDIRSAVMNIFRVPLNALVVLLLLKVKYFSSATVFKICAVTHAMAFFAYGYFYLSTIGKINYKTVYQSELELYRRGAEEEDKA